MGMFGLALAGAGAGASEVANKYIDQELTLQRAQAIADIQRTSDVTKAGQLNDLANDPTRRAAARTQSTADTIAAGGAADTVGLNRAGNTALTDAEVARSNRVSSGTLESDTTRAAALGKAKPADLAPGAEVWVNGIKVASNDKPTMVDAYREGWRMTGREQRDRAFESTLADLNKQEAELTQQMAVGMRDGSLTPTMPKAESHLFGADTPGKDPAYERYQWFQKRLGVLQVQRSAAIEAYRSVAGGGTGASTVDPLGLREKGKGAPSAPSRGGDKAPMNGDLSGTNAPAGGQALHELPEPERAAVLADVAKTGAAENFTVNGKDPITGQPRGTPMAQRAAAAAPPAPLAARAAAAQPPDIPPPPPETITKPDPRTGVAGKPQPNPAYLVWQRTWGQAWEQQQQTERAAGIDAMPRVDSVNSRVPYGRT